MYTVLNMFSFLNLKDAKRILKSVPGFHQYSEWPPYNLRNILHVGYGKDCMLPANKSITNLGLMVTNLENSQTQNCRDI